ncbi:MAG: aminotransferase class I/II-fold pyridoxal phosphate-dependent enzyme, partial [Bacteroidales bacterium]|nr:aminotransferase class I/II-fold pyridoxal phosphate-dependent enzyme [Bacteroidales bacterium]
MNFALVGVAGYIAPRHLAAIAATGHNLVAAYDPFDSVGRLDASFPHCQFFCRKDNFENFIESVRGTDHEIQWLSICTPNHTHASYIRYGLTHGMNVICEKPVVLHSSEIAEIMQLEAETGHQVYTILQLRLHQSIAALKQQLDKEGNTRKFHHIDLTYITSRGQWYKTSWKGDIQKSGGIATNIGVHLFDMIQWLFGNVLENVVEELNDDYVRGHFLLDHALVNYFLSINSEHLPPNAVQGEKRTYRTLNIDGNEFEFSQGFTELHTLSYQEILAGRGFRIAETINSIRIVEQIRPKKQQPILMVDLKGQYKKIESEVQTSLLQVLENGSFIGGMSVRNFEQQLSRFLSADHRPLFTISCASGTDALQLALMALMLRPGDEILVPAFTYAASAEVIALLGLIPVWVDVDPIS